MSRLGQIYQAAELPENDRNFDPIPAGWYTVQVKESELKDSKSGEGQYINIQWEVQGPSYEGRIVFDRINIRNNGPNRETVERIGLSQLREIMTACGLPKVEDTDELIGCRCEIKVDIDKKPSPGYDPGNIVKNYRALKGSPAPQVVSTKAPAPAAASTPPWKR